MTEGWLNKKGTKNILEHQDPNIRLQNLFARRSSALLITDHKYPLSGLETSALLKTQYKYPLKGLIASILLIIQYKYLPRG